MKIRSITLFSGDDPRRGLAASAVELLHRARERMRSAGFEVQSLRLAGGDPRALLPDSHPASQRERGLIELAQALEARCDAADISYASVGSFAADDELLSGVPAMLAESRRVFAAARMDDARGIDLRAVRRCAAVVHQNATIEADGFANLRFAALSAVAPGVPFLPAAHHDGRVAAFAVAVECADLFLDALRDARDPGAARRALVSRIEEAAARIEAAVAGLDAARFLGMDFSPAPFPEDDCSLAAAMESLGLPRAGAMGSTAAAAYLASALDQAEFRRSGFNGLFFPVLEDSRLALRAAEGEVVLRDLLLWSTVCGTGLDTVPLPGDTGEERLFAILLEVAALGRRLAKPLTARLMPIPGRSAGDALRFDFPFFADGAVMEHGADALGGVFAGAAHLPIDPRPRAR